jgi:2-C-methyl-D-erythritol 4-phosphate cytidylyltransferase
VLPAGGVGARFGAEVPKQLLTVQGQPLWVHAVQKFLDHSEIEAIVLVCPADWWNHFDQEMSERWPSAYASQNPQGDSRLILVVGGAERWMSVRNGVMALPPFVESVLVHDVARPFLPKDVLDGCLQMVREQGACLVAKPVYDTVKIVEDGVVQSTMDRRKVWLAQTPQAFRVLDLHQAYEWIRSQENFHPTDEASLMESCGFRVPIYAGSELNDKVTTPMDLERLSALLQRKSS